MYRSAHAGSESTALGHAQQAGVRGVARTRMPMWGWAVGGCVQDDVQPRLV